MTNASSEFMVQNSEQELAYLLIFYKESYYTKSSNSANDSNLVSTQCTRWHNVLNVDEAECVRRSRRGTKSKKLLS